LGGWILPVSNSSNLKSEGSQIVQFGESLRANLRTREKLLQLKWFQVARLAIDGHAVRFQSLRSLVDSIYSAQS